MAEQNGQIATIRKSCQFCRSRKIRCSGGDICNACRTRSINCVYGREETKGRPKSDKAKHRRARNGSVTGVTSINSSSRTSTETLRQISGLASPPLERSATPTQTTLSTKLEAIFDSRFGEATAARTISSSSTHNADRDPFDDINSFEGLDRVNGFDNLDDVGNFDTMFSDISRNVSGPPTGGVEVPREAVSTMTYEELFFSISHSMVEIIVTLLGSLGYSSSLSLQTWYFAERLDADLTSRMFEPPPASSQNNPLPTEENRLRQLMELWFTHHPLSIITSKTLLFDQQQNGNLNRHLLAAMLADANYLLEEDGSSTDEELFKWAEELLTNEPWEGISLATIQTMLLVAWHELCCASARRAYCYLQLVRQAIPKVEQDLQSQQIAGTSDFINGVSVTAAEMELLQRIHHLVSALELWTALQLKLPLSESAKDQVALGMPPLMVNDSPVLALDKASGNVATLKVQTRLLRQLWPMCHIASTIAPIYRLYPHVSIDQTASSNDWESRTLNRLRSLSGRRNDVSSLCRDVYGILSEGLITFEQQDRNHVSKTFAIAAYKVILIHILFPKHSEQQVTRANSEITLNQVVQNVTEFRDLLHSANAAPPPERGILDNTRRCNEHIFGIGLDACARALDRLFDPQLLISDLYQNALTPCLTHIAALAAEFAQICEHFKLQSTPGLRAIGNLFLEVRRKASMPTRALLNKIAAPNMPLKVTETSTWQDAHGSVSVPDFFADTNVLGTYNFDMNLGWSGRPPSRRARNAPSDCL